MTDIGMVRQVGRSMFLRSHHVPSKGWAPASPKFWRPLSTPKQFHLKRPNLVW